ncbi:MAG: response regulator, partial [Gammaproteobacteria bacterium]|nr:response regulator [Gammaproteobacteria bacterium]
MRLLMKESLLCGDYHIDEVESGRDAITYINKHVPDVVLLDVRMPEMSGFDVCSEIRKKHDENNISIIMVTGLDDSESIEKAFQLGATDFITKPINWDIFPYRIQYAVKARTAFNELIKRQTHLDRMETISQIISPGDNRNHILKNALSALIEIFNADRSFIINITDKKPGLTSILHEALKDNIKSLYGCEELLSNEKLVHINSRLSTTDIIVRNYQDDNSLNIVREMSIPLHKNNKHTYFLSLHQCSALPDWSSSDRETFKSIAERLAAVLSQNLLIENLHQSQNLLRQAEHISHLGNWSWDILSGAIKWSDEVYKIYSQLPDKFTPTFAYINSVTHKHDIAILNNFKKSIFKSGKAHSVEFRIITPDNDIRYIYQQGIGVINSDGDVYVVNGTIRDITENKKTTIALFESEARFRRLAENAPDAIFRISLPDEQFEYISPAAFSFFGYKPDEFQDVTWLLKNVITSNNRKYFKSQWIETKQGRNTTSFEYSIQKKTKDTRWLNQHNVPIIDDITNELIAIEGIIYDVTTKRRMHEKLLESESDMRGILTNLQDTFFRINTSGRIIMASESVNDLLHLSPFELLGKKFGDLFVNNDEYDNFIRELANNNGILIS